MNDALRAQLIAYLIALNLKPDMDSYEVETQVKKLNREDVAALIGRVEVSDGATKICLIFKNFPFVIKWDTDKRYGEAMKEVSIYKDAVACGLEFLFPKTELFYKYNGLSFVIQEKVDCSVYDARFNKDYVRVINRITRTPTNRIYEKMEKEFKRAATSYRRDLDASWAKMVISLYGKKVAKALCEFVIAHEINDLHSSNIGYKDFRPIILDFSGYHR